MTDYCKRNHGIMAVKPVGRKTDHNGLLLKPSSKVSPFYRKLLMSNSLIFSVRHFEMGEQLTVFIRATTFNCAPKLT